MCVPTRYLEAATRGRAKGCEECRNWPVEVAWQGELYNQAGRGEANGVVLSDGLIHE